MLGWTRENAKENDEKAFGEKRRNEQQQKQILTVYSLTTFCISMLLSEFFMLQKKRNYIKKIKNNIKFGFRIE